MAAPAATAPQEIYVHFSEDIVDAQIKALIKAMAELANQGVGRVILCLATDGGNIASGIQLYNVLRAMPVELVVHAVGDVSSAGNIVFVAGRRRVASPHARFTFHEPSVTFGQQATMDVKQLREQAAQLQSNGDRNRAILEEWTKLTRRQINALKRRTSTVDARQAATFGLAHSVNDLSVPAGVPQVIVAA
jgi:ATP-dependent protease ClpP protease subunit